MANHGKTLLEKYVSCLLAEIIFESKQTLINVGLPEIVASIMSKKFGKNDFVVATWYKESKCYQFLGKSGGAACPKDWWAISNRSFFKNNLDITDLVHLYETSKNSKEDYDHTREELGLSISDEDIFDPSNIQRYLKAEISESLFTDVFFSYLLIKDIANKKLTDLKPYKSLNFRQAKNKYDTNRIFTGKQSIKTYKNGWRWIDVGSKCQLVGGLMKNCGSAGVMSTDQDRTILTLFDTNNKPHVVVTYSPNDKRLSGDEGAAGSAVKDEYHDYVLDLADYLGAKFDFYSTKSKPLKLKSALRGKIKDIKSLPADDNPDGEYYKIILTNGTTYFTNTHSFIPEKTMKQLSKRFGSIYAAYARISMDPEKYIADRTTGIVRLNDLIKQL